VALVGHFWSGKHHRTVKGIDLITLYYSDVAGQHFPVSYRVYDKDEGKSKNDYFFDMLTEVLAWGLQPTFVTGDSWFSSVKNFKAVKNHGLNSMFAVKLFRQRLKDELRHYAVHLSDATRLSTFDRNRFSYLHDNHWKIEQYHRDLFQKVIATFIHNFVVGKDHLNPQFLKVVNA
jgi:hypothetical protein